VFQKDKLPVYDIPNVDGFELLPYVEYLCPLLDPKLLNHQQKVNRENIKKLSQAEAVPVLEKSES
jgi:hypothetical protein